MIGRLNELKAENQQASETIKQMGGTDPELMEAFRMIGLS
jgi:hypothetical protein